MGQEVDEQEFSREDRTAYRAKVRRCLDVFARMLSEFDFSVAEPKIGIEVELNLIDASGDPALKNAETLAIIADDTFQTELGQFNIEINVPPGDLSGAGLEEFESSIRNSLNAAATKSSDIGVSLLMVGILPTLRNEHMTSETFSTNTRYHLLSDEILAARGEDIEIVIDGIDRLTCTADTIIPEAACTSTQLHVQVEPEEFAPMWNSSQAIAGIQLALGANSPFLLGKLLWHETRIALFEQSTDTRSDELRSQGVRPRVWFGERWITSVFDLFEENVRYFPALLPIIDDEDPLAVLNDGGVPNLGELRLHNGTVYRWNRPIYDIADGRPHLRIENRILPAGPTVVDTLANAAFYFGTIMTLAAAERPVWSQFPFLAAEQNFHAAARFGIDADVYWPNMGTIPAAELTLRNLLPLAHEGLERHGVAGPVRERLLGIIEQRCLTRRNGATWLISEYHRHLNRLGDGVDALRATTLHYEELMHTNRPAHTWTHESN